MIYCAWPVKQLAAAIMMHELYKMCRYEDDEKEKNGVWNVEEHLGEV